MKLKLKKLGIESGGILVVVLNASDASPRNIHPGDRLTLFPLGGRNEIVGIVDITSQSDFVAPGEIGLFSEVQQKLAVEEDDVILRVKPTEKPD